MGSILSSSLSKRKKKTFKNSITITKMNRGDLIFIATVDLFKNSRSISGVGSEFLHNYITFLDNFGSVKLDNFGSVKLDNFGSVKLDNFASVKLDPTPLSEQNQTINKIMVNWSGSEILAKQLYYHQAFMGCFGIFEDVF